MAETEIPQVPFVQAFAGAVIGSMVNVLLHFIGPQKTRELVHTAFALADRHRDIACTGECTFFDELSAIVTPHLAAHVPERDMPSIITLIDNVVELSGASAEESNQMVMAIFNLQGVDTARLAAPVVA